MNLREKLEKASSFVFFESEDIEKAPDICGLVFSDTAIAREGFNEILEATEKGFVRIGFYTLGSSLRLLINDIKNRPIVEVNNIQISDRDLNLLMLAYRNHPHYSFGFGIFQSGDQLLIHPITQQDVVLTIKSWEIIEY